MNKFILLIGLLLLGIIVGFQGAPNINTYQTSIFSSNQEDSILWNRNRKLTWDDFKGIPNYNEIFGARTYFSVSMNFDVYKDSIIIYIKNRFLINKSWVKKKDIESLFLPLLLEHEQGHFDLGEIRARKTRMEISKYISKDYKSTSIFFNSIYNEQTKNYDIMNNNYEKDTDFGRDKIKQKEWTTKIGKMLNDLEAYSSPKVVIKRVGW